MEAGRAKGCVRHWIEVQAGICKGCVRDRIEGWDLHLQDLAKRRCGGKAFLGTS